MKFLPVIIALVLAAVAVFVILQFSGGNDSAPVAVQQTGGNQQSQNAPATKVVDVYVAATQIPIGTVITRDMVATQPWPEHLKVDSFVSGDDAGAKLEGMIARAPFERDEPLNMTKLVNPEDPNFIANSLPEGKRLVTISTDVVKSVGGFVFPGDRVDVLFSYEVDLKAFTEDSEADLIREDISAAETLLYDVRVLAVDQNASAGIDPEKGIIIPRSVSLEVTPEQAQKIRLAEDLGSLSLSLRSLKDKDSTVALPVVDETGISVENWSQRAAAAAGASSGSKSAGVRIVRGTEVEETEINEMPEDSEGGDDE